jgi:hypothetical protein
MALRSNDKSLGKIPGKSPGRIWVPDFLRPQWGVRGSLFAAFAVIAGMAIIISAVAALVLGRLGGNMVDLTGRDIPRLAASLQLAAQSASLAGQGPALLASQSEEALNERAKKMKETQEVTLQKLGEIIELGADKTVAAALSETVKNIDDTINSLGAAARERLAAAAEHEKLYDALRSAQTNFGAVAHPAKTDAQARIRATLGSANPALDEAAQAAQEVDQLGTVIAGGNLMAFEMTAALSANSSDALEAIGKEFKITQQRVKSNLDLLPKNPDHATVGDAALKLLTLGEGKTGVFKIRQKELDEAGKLNVGLGISVQQLVDGVQTETDASTWHARQEISLATTVMLALGALTFIASVFCPALCRRQHPAADRQSAALDAAVVERRPSIGNLSQQPAR